MKAEIYETYFESLGVYISTKDGKIKDPTDEERRDIEELIFQYFEIKRS